MTIMMIHYHCEIWLTNERDSILFPSRINTGSSRNLKPRDNVVETELISVKWISTVTANTQQLIQKIIQIIGFYLVLIFRFTIWKWKYTYISKCPYIPRGVFRIYQASMMELFGENGLLHQRCLCCPKHVRFLDQSIHRNL